MIDLQTRLEVRQRRKQVRLVIVHQQSPQQPFPQQKLDHQYQNPYPRQVSTDQSMNAKDTNTNLIIYDVVISK